MVVIVVVANASRLMDLEEGDRAESFHRIAQHADEAEFHHGRVGVEEHGLGHRDRHVIAVKRDPEVAVTGVGLKQGLNGGFTPLNHLHDSEGVSEVLASHGVVVVDTNPTGSHVGEVALTAADVDRCTNVELVGVTHRAEQFVTADGLHLSWILLTVGFGSGDRDVDVLVRFCLKQRRFKAGNQVATADDANHWRVFPALLVGLVFFRCRLAGGLDEVPAGSVKQVVVDVDDGSFLHALTSSGAPSHRSPVHKSSGGLRAR